MKFKTSKELRTVLEDCRQVLPMFGQNRQLVVYESGEFKK